MKKVFAYLMIIIGIVIAAIGLGGGTPLVQDHLPINLMLPADYEANHHYIRVVPAEPQAPDYLPYVLLLLGFTTLIVGLILRRKVRGVAA